VVNFSRKLFFKGSYLRKSVFVGEGGMDDIWAHIWKVLTKGPFNIYMYIVGEDKDTVAHQLDLLHNI